jgi:hypothetical protein
MPGTVPTNPAIYHITHLANLPGILRDGCLWSDSERIRRSVASTNIGHKHIKQRRLKRAVSIAAGGALGDYVPFNFCSRSVMGHADLGYAIYFDSLAHLAQVNWTVMPLTFWAGSDDTREKRQAEFLVHESFPWSAVEQIGVRDATVAARVQALLGRDHPPVQVHPGWYYWSGRCSN